MPKTRDSIIVQGRTVDELTRELNFFFQRLADRMDKIEGIRGTAAIASDLDMNQNRVTDMAAAVEDTDALRKTQADLTGPTPTLTSLTITSGDLTLRGDIKIYDADGNLIHSME